MNNTFRLLAVWLALAVLVTGSLTGVNQTYAMGFARHPLAHVFASAFVFTGTVNAIVAAGLGAVIADAAGTRGWVTPVISCVAGVAYFLVIVYPAHRGYRRTTRSWTVRFPAPGQTPTD